MPHWTTWQHVRRCASSLIPKVSGQSGSVRCAPCATVANARRRQPFHSVCASSAQRQSSSPTYSDRSPEERLLAQLHQLSRTGARAQREAVWGLYQRLGRERVGIHNFAPKTVLRLLELLAGDEDELRALARLSAVVKAISSRRQLTEEEVRWVQRICCDIDEGRLPSIGDDSVGNGALSLLNRPASKFTQSEAPMKSRPSPSLGPTAKIDDRPSADSPSLEVAQLRKLLSSPPITIDPTQVWQLYRTAISAGTADGHRRLAREDMRDLVIYCGGIGNIAGRLFLAQIETDATTDPLLYPTRFRVLITAYAKLGLLDDARRCYYDALQSEFLPLVNFEEFSMSLALFRSLRHKEGRALFDKLALAGQAQSFMYGMLTQEYVLTWNTEKAFALLADMRRGDVEPTLSCFRALATACALDLDSDRGSRRLGDLIACMKSWGCAPDKRFFVAILKGYHKSGQHSMFDGLVQRLMAHGLGSDAMLSKVVMENAAARADADLAVAMARIAAQLPENIPQVVQVLSQVGLASELATCVDLAQYPDNNVTANARLCIALESTEMAADPQALVDEVERMVERGFTPSFQLFFRTIRHIRLHGSQQLAIQTYTKLAAAGVPRSIALLFFVLQMHLKQPDTEAAIAIYEELHERLRDSDFTKLHIYRPTMEELVLLLIEYRGIGEARQAFDFLSGLPVNRQYLPYAPLIEYYVNHKMFDESHSLISYVVQHDIPLKPRTVNLYCRHLASHSSSTDLANFLRYVQRTQSLHAVADDILGAFFAVCALGHKVADLEWVIEEMSSMRERFGAWSAAIDHLAAVDSQMLPFVVHTAINASQKKMRTAVDLLYSTVQSRSQERVADLVLTTLEAHGVAPSHIVYKRALTAFTQSWLKNYSSPKMAGNASMSKESLLNAMRRHIAPAVKARIPGSLVTIAMQALSSPSRSAYKECLDFLSDMAPERLDERFYCAIAGSCSHYGMVEGVDSVLEAMRQRGFALTSKALTSLLHCYANLKPPREMSFGQAPVVSPPSSPAIDDSHLDPQAPAPPPDIAFPCDTVAQIDFAHGASAVENDTAFLAYSATDSNIGFYSMSLTRVMSIWKEFEYLGLPVSGSGYGVVARAHIKAGKHKSAEALFVEMVNRGIPHNEITAALWIESRLIQNDASGALKILGAIGNPTRCAALALGNSCFNSLDTAQRTARQFSVVIRYYLARGDVSNASAVMSAMHKCELTMTSKLYAELLRQLAQNGSHDAFVDTMRQMVTAGVPINSLLMDTFREYSSNRKALASTSVDDASQV